MDFLVSFSAEYKSIFVMVHLFAMVLGLGGATYCDILLLKFLKDLRICQKEAEVIHTLSYVILVGIILSFLSGGMLFLADMDRLMVSGKFWAKMVAFCILTVNGFLLHRIVLPKLIDFSFHKEVFMFRDILHLRHIGMIMGAVSGTSWYMAFLMGSFRSFPFSFWELIGMYFVVMGVAIFGALVFEKKMKQRALNCDTEDE